MVVEDDVVVGRAAVVRGCKEERGGRTKKLRAGNTILLKAEGKRESRPGRCKGGGEMAGRDSEDPYSR